MKTQIKLFTLTMKKTAIILILLFCLSSVAALDLTALVKADNTKLGATKDSKMTDLFSKGLTASLYAPILKADVTITNYMKFGSIYIFVITVIQKDLVTKKPYTAQYTVITPVWMVE
jgi:hypothetical protein